MNRSIDNELLSISEAARVLGVHPETLRNWHKRGLLRPYTTLGGHRRYVKKEIDQLIQKNISVSVQAQFNTKTRISKNLF